MAKLRTTKACLRLLAAWELSTRPQGRAGAIRAGRRGRARWRAGPSGTAGSTAAGGGGLEDSGILPTLSPWSKRRAGHSRGSGASRKDRPGSQLSRSLAWPCLRARKASRDGVACAERWVFPGDVE